MVKIGRFEFDLSEIPRSLPPVVFSSRFYKEMVNTFWSWLTPNFTQRLMLVLTFTEPMTYCLQVTTRLYRINFWKPSCLLHQFNHSKWLVMTPILSKNFISQIIKKKKSQSHTKRKSPTFRCIFPTWNETWLAWATDLDLLWHIKVTKPYQRVTFKPKTNYKMSNFINEILLHNCSKQ